MCVWSLYLGSKSVFKQVFLKTMDDCLLSLILFFKSSYFSWVGISAVKNYSISSSAFDNTSGLPRGSVVFS